MKKIFFYLVGLLVFIMVPVASSCKKSEVKENKIVGKWQVVETKDCAYDKDGNLIIPDQGDDRLDQEWFYLFNEDKTGKRYDYGDAYNLTWEVMGNSLYLTFDDHNQHFYIIECNSKTLSFASKYETNRDEFGGVLVICKKL